MEQSTITLGTSAMVGIGRNASNITFTAGPANITTSSGFFMYFPITIPPGVKASGANATGLVPTTANDNSFPQVIWYGTGPQPTSHALSESFDLSGPATLYVPYTAVLNSTIDVAQTAEANFQTRIAAYTTTLATSGGSANITTTIAGSTSSTTTVQASTNPSGRFTTGALAGGIVGAFVGALLLAFLIWFIVGRRSRRARRSGNLTGSKETSSGRPSGDDASYGDTQEPMKGMGVVGWEKHLPQEKDDRANTSAVKSLFEHVNIHLEGYYGAKAQSQSSNGVEALELYPCDNLSQLIVCAEDNLPLLEGIVLRWLVHRISLRAPAAESFLPREYTSIPGHIQWHMEHDGLGESFPSESRKGFFEAFSKWRVLTGFLHPNIATDQDYRKALDLNVEASVRILSDALAPWAIPGKSGTNRTEGLRQILYQAGDAGVLLFTQPATFMFDWSNDQCGPEQQVIISPAVVIKPDTRQGPMQLPQVLLDAKRIRLPRT